MDTRQDEWGREDSNCEHSSVQDADDEEANDEALGRITPTPVARRRLFRRHRTYARDTPRRRRMQDSCSQPRSLSDRSPRVSSSPKACREDAQPEVEALDVHVLSLSGAIMCKLKVARSSTSRALQVAVARDVDCGAHSLTLALSGEALNELEARPLLTHSSLAPVLLHAVRRQEGGLLSVLRCYGWDVVERAAPGDDAALRLRAALMSNHALRALRYHRSSRRRP